MGRLRNFILETGKKVLEGHLVTIDEAEKLMDAEGSDLMFLFASADQIREEQCGDSIHLCGIVNAKSGACSEDCVFCSQSAKHKTAISTYNLLDSDSILEASHKAAENGAGGFGIVAAWRGIKKGKALDCIIEAVTKIKKAGKVAPHVSLGLIDDPEVAQMLHEAGVTEYNINLEAGPDFFPKICASHQYDDRIKTIKLLKAAGIKVCSGGIFGLGETVKNRVELAMELQRLDVDTVPLNFYHHTEGNSVVIDKSWKISPLNALKIGAVFRFVLPNQSIKIAGGRESTLGEFQSMMFLTGLNSSMVGDYLTTRGRSPEDDLALVKQSGLRLIQVQDEL